MISDYFGGIVLTLAVLWAGCASVVAVAIYRETKRIHDLVNSNLTAVKQQLEAAKTEIWDLKARVAKLQP